MQDRNDFLEIVNTKVGALDDLQKERLPANAVQRTIAILPQKGEVVKLRGLDFEVRFVNKRTGEIRLALIRGAEHPTQPTEAGGDASVPPVAGWKPSGDVQLGKDDDPRLGG